MNFIKIITCLCILSIYNTNILTLPDCFPFRLFSGNPKSSPVKNTPEQARLQRDKEAKQKAEQDQLEINKKAKQKAEQAQLEFNKAAKQQCEEKSAALSETLKTLQKTQKNQKTDMVTAYIIAAIGLGCVIYGPNDQVNQLFSMTITAGSLIFGMLQHAEKNHTAKSEKRTRAELFSLSQQIDKLTEKQSNNNAFPQNWSV